MPKTSTLAALPLLPALTLPTALGPVAAPDPPGLAATARPLDSRGGDLSGDLSRDLAAFVDYLRTAPGSPSGCVLVARDGDVLIEAALGVADADGERALTPDHVVDVASITKQFTAAGHLALQEDGALDLDDPLAKHLEGVPDDKAGVTLRHLVNHTSGIANGYEPDASRDVDFSDKGSAVAFYLDLPVVAEPGAEWAYSNLAYNLLAAVIEARAGTTWEAFLRARVFGPAGMEETWCLGDEDLPRSRVPRGARGTGDAFPYGEVSHWAGYRGAGGVHSTVRDLFLWDRALRSDRLLDEPSRAELFTPGLQAYALGWRIDRDGAGRTRAWHSGIVGAFNSRIVRGLDDDLFVAVLTNEAGPQSAHDLSELLYELAAAGHVAVPSQPAAVDAETRRGLVGRYVDADGRGLGIVDGERGLEAQVLDWELARAHLRSLRKIVDGGATVNVVLEETLTGLRDGDVRHLHDSADENSVERWGDVLRGESERGDWTGHEIVGYYFSSPGHVEQFVRLRFGAKESLARLHWVVGKLRSIELDVDAFVTIPLTNVGAGVFRMGEARDWRDPILQLADDGLRINGRREPFLR